MNWRMPAKASSKMMIADGWGLFLIACALMRINMPALIAG